jgi:mono/diheme cytochrome c family protein
MKPSRAFLGILAGVVFAAAGLWADDTQPTNAVATTPPVFVPDMTHAHDPLPDGLLAWDALTKTVDTAADQDAHLSFNFTNVSSGNVVIVDVHPSCGCTTAQLPPRPWIVASGTSGQIPLTVNLVGKPAGTYYRNVDVSTDKGMKRLVFALNVQPPVIPTMTDADRARGVAAAKFDRQAVFKNDCATCHAKPAEGKYGQALYAAVCAICHEGPTRATVVPDLHTLKTPTNTEFWQTWIAHGKPGSLMPAFSATDGGPLSDMQIAALAVYLNTVIPSRVAPASVQ